jgi:propanol-preferring alcohol dehydrogenase
MRAQVITGLGEVGSGPIPLELRDVRVPDVRRDEILLRISACGVCHTELDEIEGRTPPSAFPRIPGHQVIGHVERLGSEVADIAVGERRGVAWIFSSCGECPCCLSGRENLCPEFRATGRDSDGGYAEYMTVPARFSYAIPDRFSDVEAAPLLCAGAVGYRSLSLAHLRNGRTLGLSGFGASAHLVIALARHLYPDSPVVVFARSEEERSFARELGAAWTGEFGQRPPEPPAAIIDTTPAWRPILESLKALGAGGRLVINAIRKEAGDRHLLAALDYPSQLWMEKEIASVANVTRQDVREFLSHASEIPIVPAVNVYPLEEAGRALRDVAGRKHRGANVLSIRNQR